MTKIIGYEFDNLQVGQTFFVEGRLRKVLEVGRVLHGDRCLIRNVVADKDGSKVSFDVKRL